MKTLDPLNKPEWLLAFDFDGTLSDPDDSPPVAGEFFELIASLRTSHASYWGVNTGRSLMQTVQGMNEASFPFLPDFIIAREREIYTPNPFGRWVPVSDWNQHSEKAHSKLFRKHRRLLKRMRKWVESETAAVWGFQQGEEEGIVSSTALEMDDIVRHINEVILKAPMLSYQRNGIYLRFSHRDYHKGTAMAEVGRMIGVDRTQTFAIGDSHNDLDMLTPTLAANLACPGNAHDEVKLRVRQSGGFVADGHASRGAIEALKSIFS